MTDLNTTPVITTNMYGDILLSANPQVTIGGPSWYAWLETVSSFRVEVPGTMPYQCKKEGQKSSVYWYAYVRRGGKLFKQYVGIDDVLDTKKLLDIGKSLEIAIWYAESTGQIGGQSSNEAEKSKPKPKAKHSKRMYSAKPIPDTPIVEPDLSKQFTRLTGADRLGITPNQFDYILEKHSVMPCRRSESSRGNTVYYYSAADINRMAQHVIRPVVK